MIEAELKARVREPDALRGRLRRLADEERSTYRDTYYDRPGRDLTAEGRELRVRVVDTGFLRHVDEPAAVVAEQPIPERRERGGIARDVSIRPA